MGRSSSHLKIFLFFHFLVDIVRTMVYNAITGARDERPKKGRTTMNNDILKNFVEQELNENNKHLNAEIASVGFFIGAKNEEVSFHGNHRAQYNLLLKFCAENNLTVVSTHPGTLATVIRVETEAE